MPDGDWRQTAVAAARATVTRSFLAGLRPPPSITVDEWADRHRVHTSETSARTGQWSTHVTPYLREIMRELSDASPSWLVVVRKGAQLGLTDVLINWAGYTAHVSPCPMGIVQPTIDNVRMFEKTKFSPSIAATPALSRRVAEQKARDAKGSTTTFKRFPGGFIVVGPAMSSTGLQMLSFRRLALDEVSEYPDEAGDRGDPVEQAFTRTDAYAALGRKIYMGSTPGVAGFCRVSRELEQTDWRRYYVACPRCGALQTLQWDSIDLEKLTYRCAGCAAGWSDHERLLALRDAAAGGSARWIKTYPEPETGEVPPPVLTSADEIGRWSDRGSAGRQPGFDISQLYSPFKSLRDWADQWSRTKDNALNLKAFHQQVLGLPWEEQGDAPDLDLLLARREDYPLGLVPDGALLITMGVDVQGMGGGYLQYEIVGWGEGGEAWGIDTAVIEGDTAGSDVYLKLAEVIRRPIAAQSGRDRYIDAVMIDAGYATHAVYNFARHHPGVKAIKGAKEQLAPPISLPTYVDVTWGGKRVAKGCALTSVGVYQLKVRAYGHLRAAPPETPGAPAPGYWHFSAGHDRNFFAQLTGEQLINKARPGKPDRMEWVKRGGCRNEALDCRVYALACAIDLYMDRLRPEQWEELRLRHDQPPRHGMQLTMPLAPARPPVDPPPAPAKPRQRPAKPALGFASKAAWWN